MATIRTAALAFAGLTLLATPSFADHGRRDHGRHDRGRVSGRSYDNRGVVVVQRAVPRRIAPHYVQPRVVRVVPYRPYYYPYRPGFSFGFTYGRPYYGYAPYSYGSYAYPAPAYPAPPAGYLSAIPGRPYGGVRIEDAPRDAQVFADGYYMGIVDDFDGAFQHMNLEAGPHRIEVRLPGYEPIVFDVNVVPGETVTYHADLPLER
jgi:hypothetical protein